MPTQDTPKFNDILVLCTETSMSGEFKDSACPEKKIGVVERLAKYIEFLITKYALAEAEKNIESSTGKVKLGCENIVTRLITNEFFFYTARPLSKNEFDTLQRSLLRLAQNLPQNLQLILSSFSVQFKIESGSESENRVLNTVLHVECAADAQITPIVKNYASYIDPLYSVLNGENKLQSIPNYEALNDGRFGDIKVHERSLCNNVVLTKTAGGTSYYAVTEICLDHFYSVGKDYLRVTLEKDWINYISEKSKTPPPMLCAHVLTSNTMMVMPENSLTLVRQADPEYSMIVSSNNKYSLLETCQSPLFGDPFNVLNASETMECTPIPDSILKKVESIFRLTITKYVKANWFKEPEEISPHILNCFRAFYGNREFKPEWYAMTNLSAGGLRIILDANPDFINIERDSDNLKIIEYWLVEKPNIDAVGVLLAAGATLTSEHFASIQDEDIKCLFTVDGYCLKRVLDNKNIEDTSKMTCLIKLQKTGVLQSLIEESMKKKESGDGVRFFATDDKQPHAVLKEIQAIEMDTNLSIKDKVINKLKVLSRAMNQNDIKLSDIFPSSIFENLDTRVTQEINDTPQEDSSPRQNCF